LSGTFRRVTVQPDRGAVTVEFALVLPVLLMLLLGVVEFGRLFMADQDVATASREGARYALSGTRFNDCAGIRSAATRLATRSQVTAVDVTVEYDHGPGSATFASCPLGAGALTSGDRIVVRVTRTVSPVFSVFDPVTVQASARRTIVNGAS
jgi:Flp pilus assembly protein TadG